MATRPKLSSFHLDGLTNTYSEKAIQAEAEAQEMFSQTLSIQELITAHEFHDKTIDESAASRVELIDTAICVGDGEGHIRPFPTNR